MKTLPVGVEFSTRKDGRTDERTDRRTDRQTDVTRIIVAFRNLRTRLKWQISLPFRILYIANILLFHFQSLIIRYEVLSAVCGRVRSEFSCNMTNILFQYLGLTLRRLMSYIYMEHPFLMFLDHTQRRSTVGRTPLDE